MITQLAHQVWVNERQRQHQNFVNGYKRGVEKSTARAYPDPKWSQHKALKFLYAWKENHPCADCKCFYRYFQIEADHVKGKKLYTLGSRDARKLPKQILLDELEKCEAVCRNCHAMRTWGRLRRPGQCSTAPLAGGRHLPPGASLTPWTKTGPAPEKPQLLRLGANLAAAKAASGNSGTAPVSRFHG